MTLSRMTIIGVVLVLLIGLLPLTACAAGREGERQVHKLTRDVQHAKVAGVCAGIADYFNIDVSLVRIGWVIFTLAGGAGIVAYLACWVIVPPNG